MSLDTIDGTLTRVLYHERSKWNPAGVPFLIAKLHNDTVVKGECRRPRVGESYRFFGEWQPQKGRDGMAFAFASYEPVVDNSIDGVAQYLATHVDGLGPVKSLALIETFGMDTLTVLRSDPGRAASIPGITAKVIESIRYHFEEECPFDPRAYAALIDMFSQHRVPKKVVNLLLRDWRSDAPAKVLENPYMLLAYPRMGWKTVDSFATAVAKYDPAGLARHKAAIVEALENLATDGGHTYGTRAEVEHGCNKLMEVRLLADAWAAGLADNSVACEDIDGGMENDCTDADPGGACRFMLPTLAAAEEEIAWRLAMLAGAARPLKFALDTDGLHPEQAAAVRLIEDNGVAIITGAPGTGKSWTVFRVVTSLEARGFKNIRVVAPTGKAAKRAIELLVNHKANESTAIPCTTIHRALGPQPSDDPEGVPAADAKKGRGREEFGFSRGEGNPLDCNFLVCDESSMIDVRLGAALLRAVNPGTRIVFVGDHNQLPSVGPGSMLRDMMAAGVPTAVLSTIQRSDGGGRVVKACHAIKDGKVPEPARKLALPTENWVHIELADPKLIAQQIVDLHGPNRFDVDPVWGMQVVTPQKGKLPFACDNLNRMLSAKLNKRQGADGDGDGPDRGGAGDDPSGFVPPFRAGDKVVRTKNGLCDLMMETTGGEDDHPVDWTWYGEDGGKTHYKLVETDIVNGDMGEVLAIIPGEKTTHVVVRFRTPDRLCRLSYSECHLIQAYAMTCHKAQGSGFPFVIVPVHESFYNELFTREWIYTAVSRAELILVTVGQFNAVRAAIGRKTVHLRRTRLTDLIREQAARDEARAAAKDADATAKDAAERLDSSAAESFRDATSADGRRDIIPMFAG